MRRKAWWAKNWKVLVWTLLGAWQALGPNLVTRLPVTNRMKWVNIYTVINIRLGFPLNSGPKLAVWQPNSSFRKALVGKRLFFLPSWVINFFSASFFGNRCFFFVKPPYLLVRKIVWDSHIYIYEIFFAIQRVEIYIIFNSLTLGMWQIRNCWEGLFWFTIQQFQGRNSLVE